ncbi:hypothetical protein ACFPYJ_08000 [Paenibacillus solisilvae]|uniref:DUF4359 domain-containing protein n=1 Tax=Paenibacillus solisilvae TaxID=2486751 RepID=A0ABW0VUG0_9BACL
MSKRILILVLIVILFLATNPTEEEYAAFVVNHELGDYSNGLTKAIGVPLVKSVTATTNYYIGTTFTTSIDKDHPIVVIGFLKKIFIKVN